MSYIFADPPYNTLSSTPIDVATVQGRDGMDNLCTNPMTSTEYIFEYFSDKCFVQSSNRRILSSTINQDQFAMIDESTFKNCHNCSLLIEKRTAHIQTTKSACTLIILFVLVSFSMIVTMFKVDV